MWKETCDDNKTLNFSFIDDGQIGSCRDLHSRKELSNGIKVRRERIKNEIQI